MAREGIAVRLRERWRTSADVAARAHGIHEIAHCEYASNGIRRVTLTTRIERFPAFRDDLRGERNIRRNDQIARFCTLDDLVVRHVEAGGHPQHAQTRHPRNGEGPISDQRHGDAGTLRRPKEDFFYDVRTGIRVDPNAGSCHARTISRFGFETTIYAAARLRWRIPQEVGPGSGRSRLERSRLGSLIPGQGSSSDWFSFCSPAIATKARLLFGFLDVDHPIEAYCAKCDEFWPISAEERRALLGALSPALSECHQVSYLARGLIKP